MPLGLFSSGKAQVLSEEKPVGSKKKDPKQLSENKCKGVTLELDNTRVTIEKQIAEGGFAIVYVVSDRKNEKQKYALKRQFVKDDKKLLEACYREHDFLKTCIGHKNIVQIYDALISHRGNGIYECMLLTEYYPKNLLQLMNERISTNQYLTNDEISSIFCDVCEAVAFLHTRQHPIIHRDLKVENILITSQKPPTYVLCDFGSANTKILTTSDSGIEKVQAEVERTTTMCYRSPEMIDLYSGFPLGLESDIWALGVLLFRISYFTMPFDESPLAIQSVKYQFPSVPSLPDRIKVLIYMLLDIDMVRRPTIIQVYKLAFEAARMEWSNEFKMMKTTSPTISLDSCIDLMKSNKSPRNKREPSPPQKLPSSGSSSSGFAPLTAPSSQIFPTSSAIPSGETSVAPRLRPKANTVVLNVPSISPVPGLKFPAKSSDGVTTTDGVFKKPADFFPQQRQSFSGEEGSENMKSDGGPLSCPLIKPADLGFTDLDKPAEPRDRAQTDGNRRIPFAADTIFQQQHRRNVSDTTQISRSAFKPYSSQQASKTSVRSVEDMSNRTRSAVEWNPFLAAPFSNSTQIATKNDDVAISTMDDSHFGMVFDEIRRKGADTDTSSIDSSDPFGAAPFDQLTVSTSSSAAALQPGGGAETEDERQLISDSDVENGEEEPHFEIQTKKEHEHIEDDSEIDEQRMNDRRRYSYENIDGVGDDASSDSRGKTDRDDSEEEEEEDDDSRRGGDTSHDEDSQNTVGSEDGEGGSRPLLEDDGLEDDDDHELISSFSSVSKMPPLFVATSSPSTITNPFLRDELTPKMISPGQQSSIDDDWDLGDRWTDRRDTVYERPAHLLQQQQSAFAPATLPRQVTPLVSRFKPDLPTTAPVSIIPSMSTTSFPDAVPQIETPCEPVIGTLISVGAPTDPPKVIVPPENVNIAHPPPPQIPEKSAKKAEKLLKNEKKKEKKEAKIEKKKSKEKEKAGSDIETDGSEAEMWQAEGEKFGKKKKKSTFGLRSSHPSIVANDLQFVSPIPAKKSSKMAKKSSVGNVKNSSFVNTSFQPEDPDASVE